LSSIAACVWQGGNNNTFNTDGSFASSKVAFKGIGAGTGAIGTLAFSAIMGSAGSAIGGGNFWQGATTGIIVAGFNHLLSHIKKADYVVYDGDELIWYGGDGNVVKKYPATSGLGGSQNSKFQSTPDAGPIPEGSYNVDLSLNSDRTVSIDSGTGIIWAGKGIERIPKTFTTSSGSIEGYSAWGNIRARLMPLSGNTFGRSNFYLHNSHKGYSHGCIETTTQFFNKLLSYQLNNSSINVIVNYPNMNTSTLGKTQW